MTPAACILKISPGFLAFKDGIDYKVAIWPDRFYLVLLSSLHNLNGMQSIQLALEMLFPTSFLLKSIVTLNIIKK